jgi:hypothetical protein
MEGVPSTRELRPVLLLSLILLACGALYADGPWVEKSSREWDRKDVRQILFDSPWVKHFSHSKQALEFEVPDQGPTAMELRGYHAKESKEDGSETTEFYVRWVSSRTVRQAMARRQALAAESGARAPREQEMRDPEKEEPEMTDFEIAVAGRDLSGFEHVREARLRNKCYLIVSSKPRISPTRVELARSGDGKIRGVLFHFPRKTATGEPIISTHDTKVWFIEYGGETEIRVVFNLQTMVNGKGLDL